MNVGYRNLRKKVMSLGEVQSVFGSLRQQKQKWSAGTSKHYHAWANEIIFRLSTCCGLRGVEIRRIRLSAFRMHGSRPCIEIGSNVAKGRCGSREIPLWWDAGNLDALSDWIAYRRSNWPDDHHAVASDFGKMMSRNPEMSRSGLKRRWERFMRAALGPRSRKLGVHAGRHTFCTHALASGRSLAEVRDAAGHHSISMTDNYLHVMPGSDQDLPDLFPEKSLASPHGEDWQALDWV